MGSLPLSMLRSPDGNHLVLVLSGYSDQGIQIVERATGRIAQTIVQPAAFVGAAFSADGGELFVSGGDRDVVYKYGWGTGTAALTDSIVLASVASGGHGTRYPAGMAVSKDGRWLYVAENLADSVAVVDLRDKRVVQRLATERYPYGVVVAPDGKVYASAWGGETVSVFAPTNDGLRDLGRIPAGRHPSALLLNRDGSRLFVASGSTDRVNVIDTRRRAIISRLLDPPPEGPGEGSTPNALALSTDGTRLYAAEADANAVAVFNLSRETSNVAGATGNDRLAGRIPTGWYPTAVIASGDTLLVANGKGRGSSPNPLGPDPENSRSHKGAKGSQYTYAILHGTLQVSPTANANGAALNALSARVARANGWDRRAARPALGYPPFKHVIYVIKENRTYDQVLGDMKQGDGDTTLLFFPRPQSPNHHALADRFGLFDRFFVNAEVSADGHNWSMAAYATDYLQKTVQSNYSDRGRSYDYEGTNRDSDEIPENDVSEPASGYLWTLAEEKKITFRNYGNWVIKDTTVKPPLYRGSKPFLVANTNERYPSYDLGIRDQVRMDVWLEDLAEFAKKKEMPALQIVWLPNDHTSGAAAGRPTPRAYMADNDLALGRMIDALSRTEFWRNTVVFVLEDDAQNGPDHVDSHRSPLLVVSAYNRPGVIHRFANTTDVLRTIEEILGLNSMSHFDYYGRPLREIWASTPDLRPYAVLTPSVSLDEKNPPRTQEARETELLDLDEADEANEEMFNRVLWATIKGRSVPFPGIRRVTALELKR
ncbi:MAG TPA: bifunctional YncE family protein/alkaline phosphatase family protein [Gemmatimonadaceae bacterium]|nr:bifunctional YncE family protein/alkaline phosphatase family protein [Gemmatimonadaceae bacterium]